MLHSAEKAEIEMDPEEASMKSKFFYEIKIDLVGNRTAVKIYDMFTMIYQDPGNWLEFAIFIQTILTQLLSVFCFMSLFLSEI